MTYFLKRYLHALRTHRRWLLLTLLPVALYLVLALFTDVSYEVTQDFDGYSPDAPVAAANSPVATLKLGRIVSDPNLLFLDATALAQLQNRLRLAGGYSRLLNEETLHHRVNETLALAEQGGTTLRLRYAGSDARLGQVFVAYYGDRLLKRIAEGSTRARAGTAPAPASLQPAGALGLTAERALWRPARLAPAAVIFLASVLAVLALIAWFDLADPSFRSERQIARYLGVPVLGVLPDATPLARTLPE